MLDRLSANARRRRRRPDHLHPVAQATAGRSRPTSRSPSSPTTGSGSSSTDVTHRHVETWLRRAPLPGERRDRHRRDVRARAAQRAGPAVAGAAAVAVTADDLSNDGVPVPDRPRDRHRLRAGAVRSGSPTSASSATSCTSRPSRRRHVYDGLVAAGRGVRPAARRAEGAGGAADGEGLPRLRPRHRQHRRPAGRPGSASRSPGTSPAASSAATALLGTPRPIAAPAWCRCFSTTRSRCFAAVSRSCATATGSGYVRAAPTGTRSGARSGSPWSSTSPASPRTRLAGRRLRGRRRRRPCPGHVVPAPVLRPGPAAHPELIHPRLRHSGPCRRKRRIMSPRTEFPKVSTDLPGPRSQEIFERQRQVFYSQMQYSPTAPLILDHKSSDELLHDVDGNTFANHLSAWGAAPYGCSRPRYARRRSTRGTGTTWRSRASCSRLRSSSSPSGSSRSPRATSPGSRRRSPGPRRSRVRSSWRASTPGAR